MGSTIVNKMAFPSNTKQSYHPQIRSQIKWLDKNGTSIQRIGKDVVATLLDIRPKQYTHTVLYCHGNGDTLNHVSTQIGRLSQLLNSRIVSFDWAGYGEVPGTASEKSLLNAMEAVAVYCGDLSRTIVYGYSVGSVPACYFASKKKVCKLVLLSPLASAYDCYFKNPISLGNIFMNKNYIQNVSCPTIIIHGSADDVVPIRNSELLYRMRSGNSSARTVETQIQGATLCSSKQTSLVTIEGGQHNNIFDTHLKTMMWIWKTLVFNHNYQQQYI